jgi:hypothetical protein
MGHRLMAGLRSLDPSIVVRIHVPQPSEGRDAQVPVLHCFCAQIRALTDLC